MLIIYLLKRVSVSIFLHTKSTVHVLYNMRNEILSMTRQFNVLTHRRKPQDKSRNIFLFGKVKLKNIKKC